MGREEGGAGSNRTKDVKGETTTRYCLKSGHAVLASHGLSGRSKLLSFCQSCLRDLLVSGSTSASEGVLREPATISLTFKGWSCQGLVGFRSMFPEASYHWQIKLFESILAVYLLL